MNRERILKVIEFLEKLPRHKLNMDRIVDLRGANKMDAKMCKSAGCLMGWLPVIFPQDFKYKYYDMIVNDGFDKYKTKIVHVLTKGKNYRQSLKNLKINDTLAACFFDINQIYASRIFGMSRIGYSTPKQVAKVLRYYLKHEELPHDIFRGY